MSSATTLDAVGHPFCLTLRDGAKALAEADGTARSRVDVGQARQ